MYELQGNNVETGLKMRHSLQQVKQILQFSSYFSVYFLQKARFDFGKSYSMYQEIFHKKSLKYLWPDPN